MQFPRGSVHQAYELGISRRSPWLKGEVTSCCFEIHQGGVSQRSVPALMVALGASLAFVLLKSRRWFVTRSDVPLR